MRTRRCWACGRRRPFRKTAWKPGEPALCHDCGRGQHQYEARICRWILGDHDNRDRKSFREVLARHRRAMGAG